MPSSRIKDGLFFSSRTSTWHYRLKINGRVWTGDLGTGNKTVARERREQKRLEIRSREAGFQPKPSATVHQLVEAYLQSRRGELDATSLQIVELRARLHWGPILNLPAMQVTNAEVQRLRQIYLTEIPKPLPGRKPFRRSNGGANKMVESLRQVLSWAAETGRIPEVPFKLRKLRREERDRGIVWPEQIRAWVRASKACKSVHARLAMLGAMTMGFRESEALHMAWEQMDWTGHIYRIPGSVSKDGQLRSVPLHPVFERVMRYCWIRSGRPSRGLILPAEDGGPHRPGYLRKPVATVAKIMNISGMSPHRLRATFATAVWEGRASLAQITAWLGHENPQTTMGYIVRREQRGDAVQSRVAQTSGWSLPAQGSGATGTT